MDEYNRVRFDEGAEDDLEGGTLSSAGTNSVVGFEAARKNGAEDSTATELIDMLMEQEEDEKNDGGWGEKDCEA